MDGAYGKGHFRAAWIVPPDLWFFHLSLFRVISVDAGLPGLDALWADWSVLHLGWLGPGGVVARWASAKVKFADQFCPGSKKSFYGVGSQRVFRSNLVLASPYGFLEGGWQAPSTKPRSARCLFKAEAA